jgi:excisionase family DNA binding protein
MDNLEKLIDTMECLIQQLNETELAIPSIKQGINPDAYYTVKELAEVLSVSKRTIQTWRDTKQIVYIQIKMNGEESTKGTVYFQGIDIINFFNTHKKK